MHEQALQQALEHSMQLCYRRVPLLCPARLRLLLCPALPQLRGDDEHETSDGLGQRVPPKRRGGSVAEAGEEELQEVVEYARAEAVEPLEESHLDQLLPGLEQLHAGTQCLVEEIESSRALHQAPGLLLERVPLPGAKGALVVGGLEARAKEASDIVNVNQAEAPLVLATVAARIHSQHLLHQGQLGQRCGDGLVDQLHHLHPALAQAKASRELCLHRLLLEVAGAAHAEELLVKRRLV
mmetsp:Transcript_13845/g.54709  ORF Transcript_13845/g.54709 Transcript_13845/m.54709 type:complete len:239 (+) Transcript_13845:1543-2259(+)